MGTARSQAGKTWQQEAKSLDELRFSPSVDCQQRDGFSCSGGNKEDVVSL